MQLQAPRFSGTIVAHARTPEKYQQLKDLVFSQDFSGGHSLVVQELENNTIYVGSVRQDGRDPTLRRMIRSDLGIDRLLYWAEDLKIFPPLTLAYLMVALGSNMPLERVRQRVQERSRAELAETSADDRLLSVVG